MNNLTRIPVSNWLGASFIGNLIGNFLDVCKTWHQSSRLLKYEQPISFILISLIVILAPFIPNILIALILVISAGFWLLVTICDPEDQGFTTIHFGVLLYWAISTIAMVFSPLKVEAFKGWLTVTLYLILFALSARVFRNFKFSNNFLLIYLLISLIVSAYGIRQEFLQVPPLATWNDPTSTLANATRAYSYLGNPNLLAGYLIPAVAFSIPTFFIWQTLSQKALSLFLIGINVSCLYFTDSRGGWLGLIMVFAVWVVALNFQWRNYLSPFWRKWLLPIVFISALVFLAMAVVAIEPLRMRVLSIFSGRGDSSNNFRINVWIAVLNMIKDHPLIGIGPGHEVFNKIYPNYMKINFTALSAYSIYLETAVELGIIGLISFLGLIFITLKTAINNIINSSFQEEKDQKKSKIKILWTIAAIASLAGMLTHGLVDTVWYRPEINTLWWIIIGLIASQKSILSVKNS